MRLLGDASASFEKNCVRGIQANRERIHKLLHEVSLYFAYEDLIDLIYLKQPFFLIVTCGMFMVLQSLMLVTSLNPVSVSLQLKYFNSCPCVCILIAGSSFSHLSSAISSRKLAMIMLHWLPRQLTRREVL